MEFARRERRLQPRGARVQSWRRPVLLFRDQLKGKTMILTSRAQKLLQNSGYLLGGIVAGLICSVAVVAVAADAPRTNNAIPPLMQEPSVAWGGYRFCGPTRAP